MGTFGFGPNGPAWSQMWCEIGAKPLEERIFSMVPVSISELRAKIAHPEFSQRWNEASHAIDGLEKALGFAARFGVNVKLWIEDEIKTPEQEDKPSELTSE
jgi:hypothetical protein